MQSWTQSQFMLNVLQRSRIPVKIKLNILPKKLKRPNWRLQWSLDESLTLSSCYLCNQYAWENTSKYDLGKVGLATTKTNRNLRENISHRERHDSLTWVSLLRLAVNPAHAEHCQEWNIVYRAAFSRWAQLAFQESLQRLLHPGAHCR